MTEPDKPTLKAADVPSISLYVSKADITDTVGEKKPLQSPLPSSTPNVVPGGLPVLKTAAVAEEVVREAPKTMKFNEIKLPSLPIHFQDFDTSVLPSTNHSCRDSGNALVATIKDELHLVRTPPKVSTDPPEEAQQTKMTTQKGGLLPHSQVDDTITVKQSPVAVVGSAIEKDTTRNNVSSGEKRPINETAKSESAVSGGVPETTVALPQSPIVTPKRFKGGNAASENGHISPPPPPLAAAVGTQTVRVTTVYTKPIESEGVTALAHVVGARTKMDAPKVIVEAPAAPAASDNGKNELEGVPAQCINNDSQNTSAQTIERGADVTLKGNTDVTTSKHVNRVEPQAKELISHKRSRNEMEDAKATSKSSNNGCEPLRADTSDMKDKTDSHTVPNKDGTPPDTDCAPPTKKPKEDLRPAQDYRSDGVELSVQAMPGKEDGAKTIDNSGGKSEKPSNPLDSPGNFKFTGHLSDAVPPRPTLEAREIRNAEKNHDNQEKQRVNEVHDRKCVEPNATAVSNGKECVAVAPDSFGKTDAGTDISDSSGAILITAKEDVISQTSNEQKRIMHTPNGEGMAATADARGDSAPNAGNSRPGPHDDLVENGKDQGGNLERNGISKVGADTVNEQRTLPGSRQESFDRTIIVEHDPDTAGHIIDLTLADFSGTSKISSRDSSDPSKVHTPVCSEGSNIMPVVKPPNPVSASNHEHSLKPQKGFAPPQQSMATTLPQAKNMPHPSRASNAPQKTDLARSPKTSPGSASSTMQVGKRELSVFSNVPNPSAAWKPMGVGTGVQNHPGATQPAPSQSPKPTKTQVPVAAPRNASVRGQNRPESIHQNLASRNGSSTSDAALVQSTWLPSNYQLRPGFAQRSLPELIATTGDLYAQQNGHAKRSRTRFLPLQFNELTVSTIAKWAAHDCRREQSTQPTIDTRYRICLSCKRIGHYESECPGLTRDDVMQLAADCSVVPVTFHSGPVHGVDDSKLYDVVVESCGGYLIEQSVQSVSEGGAADGSKTSIEVDLGGLKIKAAKTVTGLKDIDTPQAEERRAQATSLHPGCNFMLGDIVVWEPAVGDSEGDHFSGNLCVGVVHETAIDFQTVLVKTVRTLPPSCESAIPPEILQVLPADNSLQWIPVQKLYMNAEDSTILR